MPEDRLEEALRAARMYYFRDLTMEAVAKELRTSRSTVSRLLQYARDQGYVEIRLHDPHEASPHLEREVSERFGIQAHVVPGPERATELETLEEVAKHAVQVLNSCFDSNMVLGVAWGTTVTAVSRHLVPKATRNCRIVQLNGAGNLYSSGVEYASDILRRFAAAYRATLDQFPVPTFFDHEEAKQALWRERSVRRIIDLQARADVVLFGVGTPRSLIPGHVYRAGYLAGSDLEELSRQGVVGDVATVFLRRNGTYDDVPLNARSSGPDLEKLRRVSERLCVVAEVSRVPALRGAIAAGLVTQLVIDEASAVALVADAPDEGFDG